ncbi:MAG TPA: YceI family protein, partial [Steroidobacteraceae bacterium]|nr:YceI family protein [Steroidobacteraceae bacterium]
MNSLLSLSRRTVAIAIFTALAACSKSPEATDPKAAPVVSTPAPAPANVPAGAYTLDKYHASLIFRVNHLGFSRYTAKFATFDAQLQFDPQAFATSSIAATVDAASLTLDNPPPGFTEELLNAQWLDAKQFPKMTYQSKKVEALSPTKARITGDFTMHGITKPLVLEAIFNG